MAALKTLARSLWQATRLARAMVTRYGMSDVLGKVSVNYDDMGQSLSSETRAQVEHEVRTSLMTDTEVQPVSSTRPCSAWCRFCFTCE